MLYIAQFHLASATIGPPTIPLARNSFSTVAMDAAEAGAGRGFAATPADVRLLAALPAGVHARLLDGPWILPVTDVVFDVGASGTRRVLARNTTDNTMTYAGTLYDEPVTIEQVHPPPPRSTTLTRGWSACSCSGA